ncbi:MAG: DNA-3-methyladenine glycosylase [Oscillospiraceae bacterium]
MQRLADDFFRRDVLEVAPDLVGKLLVRHCPETGEVRTVRITETEAYRGEEDTACHARHGRTPRNALLYGESGVIYVYLCYGIHWLMNIVTGDIGAPQAVLLRAGASANGPARLTKALGVDKRFNGIGINAQDMLFIADDGFSAAVTTAPRVGIQYATPEYRDKEWRFLNIRN